MSESVVLEGFIVTPAGSWPDVRAQEYGVHPPLASITAEYAVLTVPLGRLVVVIETLDAKPEGTNPSTISARWGSFIVLC